MPRPQEAITGMGIIENADPYISEKLSPQTLAALVRSIESAMEFKVNAAIESFKQLLVASGVQDKPGEGWSNKKPKLNKECLLITANHFKQLNNGWEYSAFTIEKTECDEKWYYGVFQDGDEWGAIEDLKADKYLVLPLLPAIQQPVK